MNLRQILQGINYTLVQGPVDRHIQQLSYDSRQVRNGSLFFCLPGSKYDGHDFLEPAVAAGAKAIVVHSGWLLAAPRLFPSDLTVLQTDDVQLAMALASRCFFANGNGGNGRLRLIGVTGTNGKTTTTHLIEAILQRSDRSPGLIGTLHYRFGLTEIPARYTTPHAVDLQELLSRMRQSGVKNVVMEVSSHALDQRRVLADEYDVAVLTNITQDHLDFHGTFESYRTAKSTLFAGMVPRRGAHRYAVLNADDPSYRDFRELCPVPVVSYGLNGETADVWASDIRFDLRGLSLTAHTPNGDVPLQLQLTGYFNVYNALAALAVGIMEGIPPAVCRAALESVPSIPGRIERITVPGVPFQVLVDYAHTPDGLKNILTSARPLTDQRLIVVFGCGGDRDRLKRPIMGRMAVDLADEVVVTSDNPRSEEPQAIIDEILGGITAEHRHQVHVEPERRTAIGWAIRRAGPGDVVVIAGKGHENYQIFRDRTVHFDDKETALEFLSSALADVRRRTAEDSSDGMAVGSGNGRSTGRVTGPLAREAQAGLPQNASYS